MLPRLYINKENLKYNLDKIKSYINRSTGIIAMVKANAYGCGACKTANYLEALGIKDFGVAHVKEAVNLRKSGIKSNILVTTQFLKSDISSILRHDLSVSCGDIDLAKELNNRAKLKNMKIRIHIKVDTGMGRLGFNKDDVFNATHYIKKNFKNLIVDGIYSHLSSADSDEDYTLKQLKEFDKIVKNLQKNNINFKYIHILNSTGILKYPKYQYTHVRPGMLLYGYMESIENLELKPVISIEAPILRISEIKENSKISYNGTYVAKKGQILATIALGYADGFPRSCSNKYAFKFNDNICKVIGNVCMDMCIIDITNVNINLEIGNYVEVISTIEDIENIAKFSNTINYEIISKFGTRLIRILK